LTTTRKQRFSAQLLKTPATSSANLRCRSLQRSRSDDLDNTTDETMHKIQKLLMVIGSSIVKS
jgi:hypothetical protein